MITIYTAPSENKHTELHRTGRSLLFHAAERLIGKRLSEDDITISEKGKPVFADIPVSFNISHTKGLAVCAVCPAEEGGIGIDCELLRPYKEAVAKRAFSESERQLILSSPEPDLTFTIMWTIKEAYVKYTGTGLAGHFHDMEIISLSPVMTTADLHFRTFSHNNAIITLCTEKENDITIQDM